MSDPQRRRRAWVLSDGAAGNENQARALALALGLDFECLRLAPRAPWRWLAPRCLPGAMRGFDPSLARRLHGPWPDLVIGCGRQAALAVRLVAHASAGACRSVQILDPRIAPRHYSAVLAPQHDRLRGPNVIALLGGLNRVDDAWLAQARAEFSGFQALPGPRHALLLGGPSAALRLERHYWNSLVKQLRATLQAQGGSLLLTSSRRTPAWLRQAARAELADWPGQQWHGPEDGRNPYAGMLAWADAIVVTPDSVNMLSEAAATRVPVFFHAPHGVRGKVGAFVASLQARGRIQPLGQAWRMQPVEPLRETARVAAQLARMLGWEAA